MTIVPLPAGPSPAAQTPDSDAPPGTATPSTGAAASFADAVGKAFGDASTALQKADRAERAFASGRGGMQEMVLQRAQADIALSVASAAASRASQALSTILGMQV